MSTAEQAALHELRMAVRKRFRGEGTGQVLSLLEMLTNTPTRDGEISEAGIRQLTDLVESDTPWETIIQGVTV